MKQKAFTLVELMVVVAIIAILSAVALTSYRTFSAKAKWGEVLPCLSDTSLRLENYRTNHGVYPVNDQWAAINSDGDCSEHYEGYISVFEDGAHYVVAFCDRKKPIWGVTNNDVWLIVDTSPSAVHYRNSVEETTEDVNPDHEGNIPAECAASW